MTGPRFLRTAMLAVLTVHPALAQEAAAPPPFPEISFRRVVPPTAGQSGPRINIQITPEDVAAREAPVVVPERLASVAPLDPVEGTESWFWSRVAPGLPADPSRFWSALSLLEEAPEAAGLGTPRLTTLSEIAETHGRAILAATIGTEISPALVLAVMAVESRGQVAALSPAGAQGLMQLIPATAERFGVTDVLDPGQNIAGGVAYLDWLMTEFDRDPLLVLAAYNAGEGAVARSGGVPNYAETRTYVPRVLAAWSLARRLCRTPPELVSDGCVFQLIAVE